MRNAGNDCGQTCGRQSCCAMAGVRTSVSRFTNSITHNVRRSKYEAETAENTGFSSDFRQTIFWLSTRLRGYFEPGFIRESTSVRVSKNLRSGVHMRIPESCPDCGGRSLTYATVTGAVIRTRYRKCDKCGRTAKTIAVIPQKIFLSGNDFSQGGQLSATITQTSDPKF
jgi:hypothetical protein